MQVQQLSIKLPVASPRSVDQSTFIAVFHRWIRERVLGDRLLIDVADYRHVPDGPGVVLIGHDAHYAMDCGDGRLGLRYTRRRDPAAPVRDRLGEALRELFTAAIALERAPELGGALRFVTGELSIQVLGRLWARNTPEDLGRFQPEVEAVLGELWGAAPVQVAAESDPRRPLGLRLVLGAQPELDALLGATQQLRAAWSPEQRGASPVAG